MSVLPQGWRAGRLAGDGETWPYRTIVTYEQSPLVCNSSLREPHKAVAEVSKIGALLERLSWSVDDRVTGGWSVDV